MKRARRLSVILTGLLLAVLIPSFVGLYLFVDRVVTARTIEGQSDFMLQQTRSMRLQITSLLTAMRQLAQSLAINPVVATALAGGDAFAASQVAQQVLAQNTLVENVLLVDGAGMSVAAAVPASVDRDLSSAAFTSAILDRGMRFFIDSYPARSEVSDHTVAMVSVPVSAGGTTVGVVGVAFDMSRFSSEFLRSATVGETGYFYLIDDRGVILAHPDEELILTDFSSESFARLMLAQRGDGAGMIEYRFRDTDKNAAFTWLNILPWAVALTMDTRQFFELRDEIRIVTVVGYAIVAGVSAGLLIWILGRKMRTLTLRMATLVDAIGQGDLTGADRMKGNDELVSIYHRLLDVTDRLRTMVAGIRGRTNTARERGDTLMAVTEANMTALDAINDDIEAVVKRVGAQQGAVGEASTATHNMVESIRNLDEAIQTQAAIVEEASASIEEMSAGIDSISRTAEQTTASTGELQSVSRIGADKVHTVVTLVQEIASTSDTLTEANRIVSKVASQTNLLAMNAAIEAAHAGDAGRGFSVVAEEIRLLAEQTAENSRRIGVSLAAIMGGIAKVVSASESAEHAFSQVVEQLNTVEQSVATLGTALAEQRSGSHEILDAVSGMRDTTTQVREKSLDLNTGREVVNSAIHALEAAFEEIVGITETIHSRVGDITRNVRQVQGESSLTISGVKEIEASVSEFTV